MDDDLLGVIKLFPYQFEPRGYFLCDGRRLSVSQHTALYSLLGNTYGGNGTTDFALPDMRPVDAAGNKRAHNLDEPRYMIAVMGTYPSRPDY